MNCVIRRAVASDQHAVKECVRAAYGVYIERIGRPPAPMLADYAALIAEGVVYVLTIRGRIRGVLVMMRQGATMFVENIAIAPECQRQGLGRIVMMHIEQQTRKEQLSAIRLYTNELMAENLVFYHKLGFEEEGRSMQDGYQRVFLCKDLS